MFALVALLVSCSLAIPQKASSQASAQDVLPPSAPPPLKAGLPAIPKGSSTVIGGQIRSVDSVRDRFVLKVFGGQTMKILYDERTQVFRDSTQLSILDLHADDHASVETTLDGPNIFAIRIHLMKDAAGQTRGQVASYDPSSGTLKIEVSASRDVMAFHLAAGAPIVRVGQMASSSTQGSTADLAHGSLVDVHFKNGKGTKAVATRVDVVAAVGSTFVFTGDVMTVDLRAGRLVLTGVKQDENQAIAFDPSRFPVSSQLHSGSVVKVTSTFDGTKYEATGIELK